MQLQSLVPLGVFRASSATTRSSGATLVDFGYLHFRSAAQKMAMVTLKPGGFAAAAVGATMFVPVAPLDASRGAE